MRNFLRMKPILNLLAVNGIAYFLPLFFVLGPAWAEGDLTGQEPIDLTVKLGSEDGELRFFPDSLKLETGKLYRLNLINPSEKKHYFSSDGFSRAVFTRKVQINRPDGSAVAEIKGSIREIEVYPNGNAQWWFVPVKTGDFDDLKCTIRGHADKGMRGTIHIW